MPPLEYDAPLVCVASPACGILKHMLTFFLIKLGSEIPLHIPGEHHTPMISIAPQPMISIASTGLKYQNLMEYDCMRDSSKRWKNNDFPHIPYYHIPEHFTSNEKPKKKPLQVLFLKKNMFLAVCDGFSGILCLLWSTKICEYMWSAMGSAGVR